MSMLPNAERVLAAVGGLCLFTLNEVLNQEGTVVMTLKARGFFARQPT